MSVSGMAVDSRGTARCLPRGQMLDASSAVSQISCVASKSLRCRTFGESLSNEHV